MDGWMDERRHVDSGKDGSGRSEEGGLRGAGLSKAAFVCGVSKGRHDKSLYIMGHLEQQGK